MLLALVYSCKSKQFESSAFTINIPSLGSNFTYLIKAFFTLSKVLKNLSDHYLYLKLFQLLD